MRAFVVQFSGIIATIFTSKQAYLVSLFYSGGGDKYLVILEIKSYLALTLKRKMQEKN